MDDKDREYMAGFNLGYELEKTFRDQSAEKKDKDVLKKLGNTIALMESKSDRLEGIQEGRKAYLKEQEINRKKEKKRDRGR